MIHVLLDAEAVKTYAAAAGIDTLSELARQAGIDRSNLSRALTGERPAQPSYLPALARVLNVKPSALLGAGQDDLGAAMDTAMESTVNEVAS